MLFWPLIVLSRLEMRTLTVGLTVWQGACDTSPLGTVMASVVIASLPVLIF